MTNKGELLFTVTVIVPTLNEAENIDLLLERIFQVRRSSGVDFDVLFVDSASTDGTCDKVRTWQDHHPVRLLRRDINVGLAGAVIAAARHTKSDVVVVMDADLSHPPETIPSLIGPLVGGTHDMVIGSRYVQGGATPDWPLSRRLLSRIATLPALFFCEAKDPLAGLFAVRRERLTDLPVEVPGFKVGLAILAHYGKELRVKEIPIQFRDRDHGQSKMTRSVAWDYLRQLVGLTIRRPRKKYGT
ncbi:MAG: polyprenol monophosphomannose synthase [Desulforhopalus sp.]